MTKLILHIGTEKTGTTSIQAFLKRNRALFQKDRIYIPLSPMDDSGNHRWLPLLANELDYVDDFVISRGLQDPDARKLILKKKEEELIRECKNATKSCDYFIFSSEHFQSRLRNIEEINRLRDLLEILFEDITIVLYIRDPLKTAVSLLSTAVKTGGLPYHLPLPASDSYFLNVCNHDQTVKKWSTCFSRHKLVIRRFDKKKLINGDIIDDFFSFNFPKLNIAYYNRPPISNESLSLTGMKFLHRMNTVFPLIVDGKINKDRVGLVEFVQKYTDDGSKFLPCREELVLYDQYFSGICENVRNSYFPGESSLFEPQTKLSGQRINLADYQIDPAMAQQMIDYLWLNSRRLELKLAQSKKQ